MPTRCLCSLPRAHKYFNRASSYYFVPFVATLCCLSEALRSLACIWLRPSGQVSVKGYRCCERTFFFLPSLDSIWDLSVGLIRCPPAVLDNDYSTRIVTINNMRVLKLAASDLWETWAAIGGLKWYWRSCQ